LQLVNCLLPEEASDYDPDSLVLEVTAGVGGQEAMLFAGELLDMYQGYIAHSGWQQDKAELDHSELGMMKQPVMTISEANVAKNCMTHKWI
jgi:peptide chain release factor 1